jgi:hypothetical protein
MEKGEGMQYFAGGFYGGEYLSFVQLVRQLVENTAADAAQGLTAIFHDESHLNRLFWQQRPDVVLSPSYLYPEPTIEADGSSLRDDNHPWLWSPWTPSRSSSTEEAPPSLRGHRRHAQPSTSSHTTHCCCLKYFLRRFPMRNLNLSKDKWRLVSEK